MAQDPDLAKVLDRDRMREDSFLAKVVEAGGPRAIDLLCVRGLCCLLGAC